MSTLNALINSENNELNVISTNLTNNSFIVRNTGTILRVIPDGALSEQELSKGLFSDEPSSKLLQYIYDIPINFVEDVLHNDDELFTDFCQFLSDNITKKIYLEDILQLFTELTFNYNVHPENIINIINSAEGNSLRTLISAMNGSIEKTLIESFCELI